MLSETTKVIKRFESHRLFIWLGVGGLVLGLALRLLFYQNPGVSDMSSWKALTVKVNTVGVADVYRGGGAIWQGRAYSITYPPGSVYVLYFTGKAYSFVFGDDYPDRPGFNVFLRLPGLVAEIVIAVLIFWFLYYRRRAGIYWAGGITLAFWLNPAVIESTAVLNYTDSWFCAAVVAGLICLVERKPEAGAVFLVLAVFFKPQPFFLLPVAVIWVLSNFSWRRWLFTGLAGLIMFVFMDLPYLLSGRWTTPFQLWSEAATIGGPVSAQQNNLWWFSLYVSQLQRYMDKFDEGLGKALTQVVTPIRTDYFNSGTNFGPFSLHTWALLLLGTFLMLLVVRLWRWREPEMLFIAASLSIYGYNMLGVQAHENHLFAFIPLFVFALPVCRRVWIIYGLGSLVIFMNLFLFEGAGGGNLPLDRRFTIMDASIINSFLSTGVFIWVSYLYFSGYFYRKIREIKIM